MPISMDVKSRLDVAAAEAAARQAKSLFGNAADDISRSFSGTMSKMFDSLDGSKARRGLKAVQDEYANTARVAEETERRMVRSSGNVETAISKLHDALGKYGSDSTQVIAASNNVTDAWAASELAASRHTEATDAATAANLRMGQAHDDASSKLSNMGRVANGVGIAATASIAGIGFATVDMAAKFEEGMTRLTAAADLPDNQFKAISDGILDMAGKVGYHTGELTDAMFTIQKAGLAGANGAATAAEKLDVLKAAAQGAAIEHAPVDEVVNALTTTLHDFNLPADQAATVMSQMRTAAGEAKTTINDFAGALHSVEPAAAAAHVKLTDVWGTLAQMTQSGMSPAQAAIDMNQAITSLSRPNSAQASRMQQLGISPDDVQQHLPDRGIAGSMQFLYGKIGQKIDPSTKLVDSGALAQNAGGLQNLRNMLSGTGPGAMSDSAKQTAQAYLDNQMDAKAFRKSYQGADADDKKKLQQFGELTDKVNAFSAKLAGGRDTLETINAALGDVTGTMEAATVAFQTTGDNAEATNDRIAKIGKSVADNNNDVLGWGIVNKTAAQQAREAQAGFEAASTQLGQSFIPAMKLASEAMKDVSGFFEEHKGLGEGLLVTLGGIAGAWALIRTAMLAKDGWDLLKGGYAFITDTAIPRVGMLATKWQGLGPAAESAAAEVDGAATREAESASKVTQAASEADGALRGMGAAAEEGTAGVDGAMNKDVASIGKVEAEAKAADGALLGMGTAAEEGAAKADTAIGGFFERNGSRLRGLAGIMGMLGSGLLPDTNPATGATDDAMSGVNTAQGLAFLAGPEAAVGLPLTLSYDYMKADDDKRAALAKQHQDQLDQWAANSRNAGNLTDAMLPPPIPAPIPGAGPAPANASLPGPLGLLPAPHAAGGVFGSMPSTAVIQPGSGNGLIQWAEGSTGGEAYIPLAGGDRSKKIWAQTGHLLGVFDRGGFNGDLPGEPGDYVVTPDNVQTAMQFAQSVSGRAGYGASAGPTLFDCSGFMSALYGILTGRSMPEGQRYFTTEADFTKLGFVPGYDPDSPFNIGVHHGGPGGGHMAGNLMGYNVESGGGTGGGPLMGSGAAGPLNSEFQERYHLPGSMSEMGYGGQGGNVVDSKRVANLEEQIRRKNQSISDLEERQSELKNTAKQSERDHLQHEIDNAKRDLDKLNGELGDAQRGTFRPGSRSRGGSGAAGLGAQLPSNFGIDKGLPGMAEWGVDALMNIAAAPALAQLSAISQAGGTGPGGTTGLFGLAASQGAFPGLFGGPSAMGPRPLGGGLGPLLNGGIRGAMPGGVTGYQGTASPLDALATPKQQEGSGQGIGMGGGLMGAASGAASMGLNAMAPGAGIAAQIGMQELQRGIQYGGQMVGIGLEGLQQTFLPDLPMGGPIAKALGGLAGGHPVMSDTADQGQQGQGGYQNNKDAGATPGGQMTGQSAPPLQPGQGGDTTNNNQQSGDTVHGNQFNGPVTVTPGQPDPTAGLGMQQNMAGLLP